MACAIDRMQHALENNASQTDESGGFSDIWFLDGGAAHV